MTLLEPLWSQYAFDSPRASGPALGPAVLRTEPEDFVVHEELGFEPEGAGQHVLLKVRKRDANTQWVARELAKVCRCRPADVGYAGLKDRRAIAEQWFSVPRSAQALESWVAVRTGEFDVLEAHAHNRKLPRGALKGNSFSIRARGITATDDQLAERIELIGQRGVPNFFGTQRFGREGSNLVRIGEVMRGGAGLRALRPAERGFVLSAARSLIFNGVLAARVKEGSWDRLRAGDLANLDARGSVFAVDEVDATLTERIQLLDIHPTGPMWGEGAPPSRADVLELETRVAGELPAAVELVQDARMEQERRSLRVAVRELGWIREANDTVVLRFRLMRGSFATTVLREIFDVVDDEGGGEG